MKNNPEDNVWQELQSRIEQLHRRYLSSDVQTIEYKPGEMRQMFEMSSQYLKTQG